jgi:YVTN family beta-propeller protein
VATFDAISVLNISAETITGSLEGKVFLDILPGKADASGIEITPDGKRAYAMDRGGHVVVIDTATNALAATIAVGGQNEGIVISPDGKHAYLADFTSNRVFVLDLMTNTVKAGIPLNVQGPGHVFGLAITPDGTQVYVTSTGGHVSVIDAATNRQVGVIGGSSAGAGIAITSAAQF